MKKKNKIKILPMEAIKWVSNEFPGIWDEMKKLEPLKQEYKWPDWCYMPISIVLDNLSELYGYDQTVSVAGLAVGLAGWRKYKNIFLVNQELAKELNAAELDDVIPVEALDQLPYPYIYVQIEGENLGALVFREYDSKNGWNELRLYIIDEQAEILSQPILHLKPGGTIREAMDEADEFGKANMKKFNLFAGMNEQMRTQLQAAFEDAYSVARKFTLDFMPLILYLCAENAEISQPMAITGEKKSVQLEPINAPKDKAGELSFYPVGEEVGIRIRDYKKKQQDPDRNSINENGIPKPNGKGGTKKSPHVRRGHYHHYWLGSRTQGTRELVLRWIAPMFIHGGQETPVTINVIRQRKKEEEK